MTQVKKISINIKFKTFSINNNKKFKSDLYKNIWEKFIIRQVLFILIYYKHLIHIKILSFGMKYKQKNWDLYNTIIPYWTQKLCLNNYLKLN